MYHSYPQALHHLELLQQPQFRADMKKDEKFRDLLQQKQFDHWRTWYVPATSPRLHPQSERFMCLGATQNTLTLKRKNQQKSSQRLNFNPPLSVKCILVSPPPVRGHHHAKRFHRGPSRCMSVDVLVGTDGGAHSTQESGLPAFRYVTVLPKAR